MIENVSPTYRKLAILTVVAKRGGGDDLLAKRLRDRVGAADRRQFPEYILPMKPNGAGADPKYDADFLVGLAFGTPRYNIVLACA